VAETATGSARALTAVFIGTFALIFIGAGAAIVLGVNHDPPIAFAHGLTVNNLGVNMPARACGIDNRPARARL
jgi:glycerol uptake facilitator-like aquaporin